MSKGNGASDSDGAVFKVGVRAPPFWPQEPALWFSQMEAQFSLSGITADSTKFNYVISQLEHQYAVEVKDIINSPPAENRYVKLKTELISRLSLSQEKKSLQLLQGEQMGDRKPSQFLRQLRILAGTSVTDDFLRTVWSSRLPKNLQVVIASQPNSTLDELADLADKVHDLVPQEPQIFSVKNDSDSKNFSNSDFVAMAKQMAELTSEIASLKAQFSSRQPHSRSRSRFNSRNKTPVGRQARSRSASKPRDPSICWYHYRFGDNSTRCTRPCSYPGSENFNGSRK
ncbi:uncharacterized protein [Choristoneura fumiferana]|uniref:uncharacterized protein n=1 Tax=Choristoneura fumiferana TaxID=7141 RepID=UPI003D155AC3